MRESGSSIALSTERHQEILRRLVVSRVVKVRTLAEEFKVHEMTIRRDLDTLAEQGLVERIHGGARIAHQASAELTYQLRSTARTQIKASLARSALQLINDGDTVALDASTTCLELAKIINARRVTVIVNSLETANVLAANSTPFILVGGSYHANSRSFVGALTSKILRTLCPDKVFFSAKGFSSRAGFTEPYLPEAEVKEYFIGAAGVVVALLDHSKFGYEALGKTAEPKEVDILITDRQPPKEIQDFLDAGGTRVILAEA